MLPACQRGSTAGPHRRQPAGIVGNADAHWKNHSLLWNRGRWDVAPGYDVVCTMAYPRLDARPALSIGGCMDESRITAEHFRSFAQECLEPHGVRIQAVTLALKEIAAELAPPRAVPVPRRRKPAP